MKRVFVDFEMNPIDKKFQEERKWCSREIIEIGAVMLNDDFEEISVFKILVKPEFNSQIYKKYEELTGISTGMVSGACKFKEAMRKFLVWLGDDYEIFAWSNSDKSQITKEMKLKGVGIDGNVEYLFSHWYDFQKIFGEMVETDKLISLENALNSCGIPFSGKKHDALYDARNTSILYIESKINDISASINEIKKYLTKSEDESSGNTLGDLFDFANLELQFA